jgi:hypothetical protein
MPSAPSAPSAPFRGYYHEASAPTNWCCQAEAMAKKLESVGAKVNFIRVKNLGHGAPVGKQDPSVDDLKKAVLDFFDRELKPAP